MVSSEFIINEMFRVYVHIRLEKQTLKRERRYQMKIPQAFFKAFPAYEDVFYDEIEQHRKHFLPICSIHLQRVFAERL